jgi:hypothetical protein
MLLVRCGRYIEVLGTCERGYGSLELDCVLTPALVLSTTHGDAPLAKHEHGLVVLFVVCEFFGELIGWENDCFTRTTRNSVCGESPRADWDAWYNPVSWSTGIRGPMSVLSASIVGAIEREGPGMRNYKRQVESQRGSKD